MSENTTATVSTGLGLPTILFVVFLVLKLCDKIDWSWWWVCAPLWIPWTACIVVIMLALFVYLIAALVNH